MMASRSTSRSKSVSEDQNLFDFDEDIAPPPVSPPSKWHWWDAWPDGLTPRQYQLMQVARDMRALEECEEDERPFFQNRLALFRKVLSEVAL